LTAGSGFILYHYSGYLPNVLGSGDTPANPGGECAFQILALLLATKIHRDFSELFQCGFEVFHDFSRDDVWRPEIGGVFEGFVFAPEDVEIDLVAFDQVIIGEAFESLAFGALVAVFGVITGDEIIEVTAARRAAWRCAPKYFPCPLR
jgi:hypothetical protein